MKIAMVQASAVWEGVEANLKQFDGRLEKCVGCDLIVLPEMFASGFTMEGKERMAPWFPVIEGWMKEKAQERGAVITGSAIHGENEKFYNRLVVAFPDGNTLYYDKHHCFTMGGEGQHFTGGEQRLVFEYKGVRIAGFICYDLRFPVWCRNTDDYDIALFVANWPKPRREMWKALLRARAVENQSIVVGVNRVGMDGVGLAYIGNSTTFDAKGETVGACRNYRDEVVCVEVDIEEMHAFRKRFPVLADRDSFRFC